MNSIVIFQKFSGDKVILLVGALSEVIHFMIEAFLAARLKLEVYFLFSSTLK